MENLDFNIPASSPLVRGGLEGKSSSSKREARSVRAAARIAAARASSRRARAAGSLVGTLGFISRCRSRGRSISLSKYLQKKRGDDGDEAKEEKKADDVEDDGPLSKAEVRKRERMPRRFRRFKPKKITTFHRSIQLARFVGLAGLFLSQLAIFLHNSLIIYALCAALFIAFARRGPAALHRVLPRSLKDADAPPTGEEMDLHRQTGVFAGDFNNIYLGHEYDAFLESLAFLLTNGKVDAIFGGGDVEPEELSFAKVRVYAWATFEDAWPLLSRPVGVLFAVAAWLLDTRHPDDVVREQQKIKLDIQGVTPRTAAAIAAQVDMSPSLRQSLNAENLHFE